MKNSGCVGTGRCAFVMRSDAGSKATARQEARPSDFFTSPREEGAETLLGSREMSKLQVEETRKSRTRGSEAYVTVSRQNYLVSVAGGEMKTRAYLMISGSIFGVVAVLHVLRLVNHWPFQLGPWALPLWASWFGVVVSASLCLWAFRLSGKA